MHLAKANGIKNMAQYKAMITKQNKKTHRAVSLMDEGFCTWKTCTWPSQQPIKNTTEYNVITIAEEHAFGQSVLM